MGFPRGSAGKESACNVKDLGSVPGLGRFPGERKGYPFQYSGLENSMDCIVHRVSKNWTGLSDFHFTSGKNSACLRNAGSIHESGISPGGGNDNLLQYSLLENSMTEEPSGLQSIGSQGIGHELATEQAYNIQYSWAF